MYNVDPVAGFQFNLSGVSPSAATGGSAAAAGFTTSTSPANGTVLGFSFSGATIPPGNGLLTTVSFTVNEDEFQSCLEEVVMSDDGGAAIDFDLGDCETVVSLSGCTDMTLVTIMNLPMKMMEVAGMWVLVMTIVIAI